MKLARLKVKNLKISLTSDLYLIPGIFHTKDLIITIYESSRKLINITKIKKISHVAQIKQQVEKRLKTKIVDCQIDNVFLSRKCSLNFNIMKLINTCKQFLSKTYFIYYNVEDFRGVYLIPLSRPNPSLIIFRTGSVTVMGAKSQSDITKCNKIVKRIFCEENLRYPIEEKEKA